MWAQTIFKIQGQILIGLIERARILIERKPGTVGEDPMQSRPSLVQRDGRPYRVAHVIYRLAVAPGRHIGLIGGAENQSSAQVI